MLKQKSLLRSISIVGFGNISAKVVGFSRELAVSYFFGLSLALDEYIIALGLCTFFVTNVMGHLFTAVVPPVVALRSDKQALGLFLGQLFVRVVMFLAISLLVWFLLSPLLVSLSANGFDRLRQDSVYRFTLVLLLWSMVSGLMGFFRSILEAHSLYGRSVLASLVGTLFAMLFLLVFAPAFHEYALPFGLVGGSVLELALLARGLFKAGIPIIIKKLKRMPEISELWSRYLFLISGGLVAFVSALLVQSELSKLGAGSVSAMAYAQKMPALLLSLVSAALGAVLLTRFSEQSAAQDITSMKRSLKKLYLVTALGLPALGLTVFFSSPIVELLFVRGKFSLEDAQVVAGLQAIVLVWVPFAMVTIYHSKILLALGSRLAFLALPVSGLLTTMISLMVLVPGLGISGVGFALVLATSVEVLVGRILVVKAFRAYGVQ